MLAIAGAMEYLVRTCPDDIDDYEGERATLAALVVLERASRAINDEYDLERKRLGIGIYTPYGRQR